jgi:intein-encoded DNA endonuclease-like protein
MNAPKRKYRKYSTEEKNEMVRLYVGGMSAEAIGRQFNCFSSIIRKELIKKNIKIRSIAEALRNNKVNHDFFQNITTEKQAYWLGFLTADGCIYHNYAFGLALSIKDKDHIEKYRKDLEANYPIRIEDHPYSKLIPTANPTAKIVIYSKKIVNDLKSKGLTPRKSLMVQPYQEFAPNLRKHYWRGLIDGDGCLNFCKKWRISLLV